VSWTLGGLAAGLISVGGFNLVVDPYGTAGTGIFPTGLPRDASLKADLIDHLDRAPGTIILGSSRSLKIDPRQITTVTGQPSFNAGVMAGGTPEAYALLQLVHDRFPQHRLKVVWILEQEAFRRNGVQPDIVTDRRLSRYVPRATHREVPGFDLWRLFSWSEARDSFGIVQSEINGELSQARHRYRGFRADGYYSRANYSWEVAYNKYLNLYRRGFSIQPVARLFLVRGMEAANSWGVRPLIVIPPMSPRLLAAVRPLGWDEHHRQLLDMLVGLQQRYRFDIADMSSIDAFGGTPDAFYDGVHMRPANAARLVDALVANYRDDL
jgi:hypothetical protein